MCGADIHVGTAVIGRRRNVDRRRGAAWEGGSGIDDRNDGRSSEQNRNDGEVAAHRRFVVRHNRDGWSHGRRRGCKLRGRRLKLVTAIPADPRVDLDQLGAIRAALLRPRARLYDRDRCRSRQNACDDDPDRAEEEAEQESCEATSTSVARDGSTDERADQPEEEEPE